MELKEIQALIKFVAESGVDEVELEKKDFKLSIKKVPPAPVSIPQQIIQAPVQSLPPAAVAAPVASEKNAVEVKAPAATPASGTADDSKLITIKSPMIGTFYRTPSPDKPSFVNVGDEIKQGKVVCIIEAMKLFNEIESEISGRIVKILVENATPVEYDQPLFLVEPN